MSVKQNLLAVLVARCFIRNDAGAILVVKRSPDDRSKPGLWEVPGGKVDPGQTLEEALKREVFEETGLRVETVAQLVSVSNFLIREGKYAGSIYVAHFYVTKVVGGEVKLSEEHSEYAWVQYEDLLGYRLTPEVHRAAIELYPLLVTTPQ